LAIGKRSGDLCIVFQPFETDFGPFRAEIDAYDALNRSGAFETGGASVFALESINRTPLNALNHRTDP
jgi:hypothetical protein